MPSDPVALAKTLRAGDVLLVDGRQRVSTAIKYLTQSTCSHAALCIAGKDPDTGAEPQFIEADVVEGVQEVSLDLFSNYHTRICRPIGLIADEIAQLVDFAKSHIGDEYDLANVIDLARYLCPTPPVPVSWRRRMIALGSGEPTKAICSTLIARAFQSIRYPILPDITQELSNDPDCEDCVRDILHIRHHSLFTPCDFDVSPYFEVIKPSLAGNFDHHSLVWSEGRDTISAPSTESARSTMARSQANRTEDIRSIPAAVRSNRMPRQ